MRISKFLFLTVVLSLLIHFSVMEIVHAAGARIECGTAGGSNLLLGCSGADSSDPGGTFFSRYIPRMISWIIGLLGIIAFITLVTAGFELIMSQGNQDKLKAAQKTLIGAAIGLVIAISSYILVSIASSFTLS